MADVIVVGSGVSAVHAAQTLVEAGATVTMLDVGEEDAVYKTLIPNASFVQVRRTDPAQHRYFLGDNLEGVPLGQLGAGPQLTPPRQFILRHTDTLAPTRSPEFAALESLALGGLGGAWGAVCFPFLDHELERCGLSPAEMTEHYSTVARRIGISGAEDDLESLRGKVEPLQPPLPLDTNAERVLTRYKRRRSAFHRDGFYVGRSLLAALSQPLNGRQPNPCYDM